MSQQCEHCNAEIATVNRNGVVCYECGSFEGFQTMQCQIIQLKSLNARLARMVEQLGGDAEAVMGATP